MYSLCVTARYNPHDALLLLRNYFSLFKAMWRWIFWHIFLSNLTQFCATLWNDCQIGLVFLRQNISGELFFFFFLLSPPHRNTENSYFKQTCIILFHTLHKVKTALKLWEFWRRQFHFKTSGWWFSDRIWKKWIMEVTFMPSNPFFTAGLQFPTWWISHLGANFPFELNNDICGKRTFLWGKKEHILRHKP